MLGTSGGRKAMNAAGKANTIRELYVSVNESDTYNMQFPSGYCLQHTHATIQQDQLGNDRPQQKALLTKPLDILSRLQFTQLLR